MSGSGTEMQLLQLSAWHTAGGWRLWEMIFFATVCVLDGFQQFIIEKRSPLNVENNIVLCMTYMSAKVAKEDTKTCRIRLAWERLPKFL